MVAYLKKLYINVVQLITVFPIFQGKEIRGIKLSNRVRKSVNSNTDFIRSSLILHVKDFFIKNQFKIRQMSSKNFPVCHPYTERVIATRRPSRNSQYVGKCKRTLQE